MTCTICQRDPERMNSRVAECSHVDCPHRRRAWSNGTRDHIRDESKPKKADHDPLPLDRMEWDDLNYPGDGDA